ncbi:MAG: LuxR C-terminal-related transcriptional regulator [Acidimicrobiales bacterium]
MVDVGTDPAATFESPVIARTKLLPPRVRAETVDRPALVARRLDSRARLGVISGPAGSGKSTLLAQCHADDPFAAWLSLDSADNDPVALWWSMIGAIRTVIGDFSGTHQSRLLAAGAGAIDDIVVSVCNELAERQTPIHVLIDDVHVIENVTCLRSLHRFVAALPDGARATMTSRRSGPIPLARLRVSGDLVEIGTVDLALSTDEAHRLLTAYGSSLDEEHFDILVERTEGWPAGLHLAGLAATQAPDAQAFAEDFRGTDRDIAAYLLSEVLGSVSHEDRDFIIETSILSRLTGDLCDAVTGRSGGAEILARLAEANAFVIPLDRAGRWYRYHHLFGELVAAELRHTTLDEQLLHGRAFEWLSADGQIAAAIPHALAAGETRAAADLVCGHWPGMMDSGRNHTALALLAQFEPEYIAEHQPLAIGAASLHAVTGNSAEAMRWLDIAEHTEFDGPRPDGMASVASSFAMARGTIAPNGVDAALADGFTALEIEPAGSPWRMLAILIVGRSLVWRGDVEESIEYLEEVEQSPVANQHSYALAEKSLAQLSRGDAEQALVTAESAREVLREAGGEDMFMGATIHAAAALAAIDLGDTRAARIALRAASRPMAAVGQAVPLDATRARLLLARAALALGEEELARQYLNDSKPVIDSIEDMGVMRDQYAELVARVDISPPQDHSAPAPDIDFTERELDVIAMLPSPLTTREIGEELYLSRNTIKTYLRRVYRKLNASSRQEAVLIADEMGLLTDRAASGGRPPSPD